MVAFAECTHWLLSLLTVMGMGCSVYRMRKWGWNAVMHAGPYTLLMTHVKDLDFLKQATHDIIKGPL